MVPETILVVAGAASFSTRDVWDGYRRGLTALGLDLVPYPTFSMLRVLSHELMGNDLVGKALDVRHRINVAIFIDGLYFQGDRAWVPATLRAHGVMTVLIKTDDPYTPVPNAADHFDIVVSNELHRLVTGEIYLPTATEPPPPSLPIPDNKSIDVCFLGTLFDDRLPLIRQLAFYCEDQGIRFCIMGNLPDDLDDLESLKFVTVSRSPVLADAKWKIYADSRVVLNLFREGEGAVSPSPRVFEATALGGPALLSGPRRSEVTQIFSDAVFHYDDFEELVRLLQQILNDEELRTRAVERAREITNAGHLYRHRCESLVAVIKSKLALRNDQSHSINRVDARTSSSTTSMPASPSASLDRKLAWIIGCGRSGSTWLCEMLNDIPGAIGWHEPYFGRFFKHAFDDPREKQRSSSFFADAERGVLYSGLRRMFLEMAQRRYPSWGNHSLFVKEVNTPEFFESIQDCFPGSSLVLLYRDPFDVLDSYLAMTLPGSWNRRASRDGTFGPVQAARHIAKSFQTAINAFESSPPDRRLLLRYEELLADTEHALAACCTLMDCPATEHELIEIVERHRFDKHAVKGPQSFRRFGKAGVWKDSVLFTAEVADIANRELAELRHAMGYNTDS
jgi:hypothetical protein